jgi:hypothetical protein
MNAKSKQAETQSDSEVVAETQSDSEVVAETQSDSEVVAGPNLVSKLAVAKVIGKIKPAELPEDGTLVPLMRVMGQADGIKTGTTNYGEYCGFTGIFAAVNIKTGEHFAAAQVYLPDVATDLMRPVVEEAARNGSKVEFAFDVGVRQVKRGEELKYEYGVKPLISAAKADPLAALKAKLSVVPLPSLPAPAQSE